MMLIKVCCFVHTDSLDGNGHDAVSVRITGCTSKQRKICYINHMFVHTPKATFLDHDHISRRNFLFPPNSKRCEITDVASTRKRVIARKLA